MPSHTTNMHAHAHIHTQTVVSLVLIIFVTAAKQPQPFIGIVIQTHAHTDIRNDPHISINNRSMLRLNECCLFFFLLREFGVTLLMTL